MNRWSIPHFDPLYALEVARTLTFAISGITAVCKWNYAPVSVGQLHHDPTVIVRDTSVAGIFLLIDFKTLYTSSESVPQRAINIDPSQSPSSMPVYAQTLMGFRSTAHAVFAAAEAPYEQELPAGKHLSELELPYDLACTYVCQPIDTRAQIHTLKLSFVT